ELSYTCPLFLRCRTRKPCILPFSQGWRSPRRFPLHRELLGFLPVSLGGCPRHYALIVVPYLLPSRRLSDDSHYLNFNGTMITMAKRIPKIQNRVTILLS